MQATINNFYAQDIRVSTTNATITLVRKEAITKIALFSSILVCLVLAVNI